jgi:hypothetical protein
MIPVMVVRRPMRSGKYRLMSGGRRTFPIPIPASVTMLAERKTQNDGDIPRSTCPIVIMTMAITMVDSRPTRLAMSGVHRPKAANETGGSIPMTPSSTLLSGMSTTIASAIGETAAIAVRMLNEMMVMARSASVRPVRIRAFVMALR